MTNRDPKRHRTLVPIALAIFALVTNIVPAASPRPARADHAMAATAHPLGTEAALDMLRQGGTAADAAVAAALVVGVAEPYSAGIGGGGFLLYYEAATGTTHVLDYREQAPAAATRDMFRDADGNAIPGASMRGHRAAGVPGTVAGLFAAQERFGKLERAEVVFPAIQVATEGFPADDVYVAKANRELTLLAGFPATAAIFLGAENSVPDHRDIIVQHDLAKTLTMIANDGADAFYKGEIAQAIADEMSRGGGLITIDDLASYDVHWREPIRGTYRGYKIVTMPPPSSGGIHLVQMLNVLEHYDLAGAGFGSSQSIHWLAESMRGAYADRAEYLGDPDFVGVPMAALTSKEYAAQIAEQIPQGSARNSADVGPGDLSAIRESQHTTHLVVVDAEGNAATLTQSINYSWGCGVVVPGTGILLNNTMDDFAIAPGVPNAYGLVGNEANSVAPNKIPLSSMTPTLVFKNGELFMVVGTPGGSRIITTVMQAIINVVDHGMSISQAINAPRIHHQWKPDLIFAEPNGLPRDVAESLEAMGYTIDHAKATWSNAMGIVIDRESGELFGAADVRGVGTAGGL